VTVAVTEEDGLYRALVPVDGTGIRCCEAGHADAAEAAAHAWRLTRAIARKMILKDP
jgi:hypothetical protein